MIDSKQKGPVLSVGFSFQDQPFKLTELTLDEDMSCNMCLELLGNQEEFLVCVGYIE